MNKIRAIQALNEKEIEHGISPNASWHVDYRDTAFIYFGGLPHELSEGDIITIFSQYGEPVWIKLARDQETGKSRGFGWLKYEDQRSTDLAVDNIGGATIAGRMISVDHARYKFRDDEDPDDGKVDWKTMLKREGKIAGTDDEGSDSEPDELVRQILPEERELALLIKEHDEEDPMKEFLIEEKKKEVEEAKAGAAQKSNRKHRHHRSRRDDLSRERGCEHRCRDSERANTKNRDREQDGKHRSHKYHSREKDDDGDVEMMGAEREERRRKRRERSVDDEERRHRSDRRDRDRGERRSSKDRDRRDCDWDRDGKREQERHKYKYRDEERSSKRHRDRDSDSRRHRHRTRSRSP